MKLPQLLASGDNPRVSSNYADDDTLDSHSSHSEDSSESNDCALRDSEFSVESLVNPETSAMTVWSWGSNSNYLLGHPTSVDRTHPELIDIGLSVQNSKLPACLATIPDYFPQITNVVASKYHMCIITKKRIYVHGFGAGGRLGLGHEETTMRPTELKALSGLVDCVALGPDHSVAVLKNGNCLTWGSNEYYQLGYHCEPIGKSHSRQLVPQEIPLKSVIAIGAAASKYHTAIITRCGAIYTWGTNLGQLGYDCEVQLTPRKIACFPHQVIIQIAATNVATAVLLGTNEVRVFADSVCFKVVFPSRGVPKNISVRMKLSGKSWAVSKLVSGNHMFAALLSTGDVYMWSPPHKRYANTWQQQLFPQRQPKLVWSVRKKHLAARNIAIGISSTLLIGTDDGHVYIGKMRQQGKDTQKHPYVGPQQSSSPLNRISESTQHRQSISQQHREATLYKYTKIPALQHIVMVVASPCGAYAAVRADYRLKPIPLGNSTFCADMRSAIIPDTVSSTEQFYTRLQNRIQPTPDVYECGNAYERPFNDVEFVVEGGIVLKAHRFCLAARSPLFREFFIDTPQDEAVLLNAFNNTNAGSSGYDMGIEIEQGEDGVVQIRFPTVHPVALGSILEFVYTGKFQKAWSNTVLLSPLKTKHRQSASLSSKKSPKIQATPTTYESLETRLYLEFSRLSKGFKLDDTELFYSTISGDRLKQSCTSAFVGLGNQLVDAVVMLDGCSRVEAHQVVLASRCNFFGTLLGTESRWSLAYERQEDDHNGNKKIIVNLKHMKQSVFNIIIKWIYTDDVSDELFSDVSCADLSDFVTFVVEVLSAADELLLDQLKDICSNILLRIMDIKNVFEILDCADSFRCYKLKEACLLFICWDIETFVENKQLFNMEIGLLQDVEQQLKLLQQLKFPTLRGPDGEYEQLRQRSISLEVEQKAKRRQEYERQRKLTESDLFSNSIDIGPSQLQSWKIDCASPPTLKKKEQVATLTPTKAVSQSKNMATVDCDDEEDEFEAQQSRGGPDDDNIFQLDLDDEKQKTPKKRRKQREKKTPNAITSPAQPLSGVLKHNHRAATISATQELSRSFEDSEVIVNQRQPIASSHPPFAAWTTPKKLAEERARPKKSLLEIMEETRDLKQRQTHKVVASRQVNAGKRINGISLQNNQWNVSGSLTSPPPKQLGSPSAPMSPFQLGDPLESMSVKITSSTKMSQKQRKKCNSLNSGHNRQTSNNIMSPPQNVWGVPSSRNGPSGGSQWTSTQPVNVGSSVKSIREIQEEEEMFKRTLVSKTATRPSLLSPAFMTNENRQHSQSTWAGSGWSTPIKQPSFVTNSATSSGTLRPSGSGLSEFYAMSPPTSMPPPAIALHSQSFVDIQREQQEEAEMKMRMKAKKKSLAEIQMEEEAIRQIKNMYTVSHGSGEWIVITRK